MKAELLQRVEAAQQHATAHGHVGVFLTITLPSRFHALSGGKFNVYWTGATPKDAQHWISRIWASTRASLARKGIDVYGWRMVEPHTDGTPHWHVLAFVHSHPAADVLATAIARHLSADDGRGRPGCPGRPGEVYFRLVETSAAGLVAKYIEKNSDHRMRAWVNTWGIRPFCRFGAVKGGVSL